MPIKSNGYGTERQHDPRRVVYPHDHPSVGNLRVRTNVEVPSGGHILSSRPAVEGPSIAGPPMDPADSMLVSEGAYAGEHRKRQAAISRPNAMYAGGTDEYRNVMKDSGP